MPQRAYLRRYQDVPFWYDRDRGGSQVIRHRVYRSQAGDIATPLTSLLFARAIDPEGTVPPAGFIPRHALTCFENPRNRAGESNLKAFIPYAPGDPSLAAHLVEIMDFQGVLSILYKGEADDVESLTQGFLDDLAEVLQDAIVQILQDVTAELADQLLQIIINILLGALL